MKPQEQQKPKDGKNVTSEYDTDKKRAGEQSDTRQDVEHDEIDTKTGEYAQKQKPH